MPLEGLVDGSARDVDDAADFVVIGSGAAGATCARWLTAAGRSVIVVEEGGPPRPARGDGFEAFSTLYRDGGVQAALGGDVLPLLQGRCVGGSTYVGGAIQVGFPEEVWAEWVAADPRWATRLPWAALDSARDRLDRELNVQKTPRELWGDSGSAMFRALGGRATATWRNAPGCHGSGRCMQGCPNGAKTSADVALLPKAIARGARVYARCKVDRIVIENGAATGVSGHFASGKVLTAKAKRAVIVAASAIQTPWLLQKSGVKGVGVGFMTHPSATMAGLFHRPMDGAGATQSMESLAFRGDGFQLESLGLPRTLTAARVPGIGGAFSERLEQLDHVGIWGVGARAKARGRVIRGPWGPIVRYTPTADDRRSLLRGLAVLAESMLIAEALELWPGIHGAPEVITTVKQARDLALLEPRQGIIPMVATHFFCGVPVDDRFQAGGVRGLVVADSSIFPSNLGINPMSSIMAVATIVAESWV